MIEIIPALDLIDGQCVRLSRGVFDRVTIYDNNPAEIARAFEGAGITRLHVVDLDGAREGRPSNLAVVRQLKQETRLRIDFGGGIRSRESILKAFESGADQVSIGSVAVTRQDWLREWIDGFGPGRFFIGADVRGAHIVYRGWQAESGLHWREFIGNWMGAGIGDFFCTDVDRDGELKGPSFGLYEEMLGHFPGINLVASGGVSSIDDIRRLDEMGLMGVIIGKALYEGRFTLDDVRNLLSGC